MPLIDFSKIRLICSDIDGTLLRKESELPEYIKREIWRLHGRGIAFTFSTGRLPYEVDHLFSGIPNDVPYVAGNGAVVKRGNILLAKYHYYAESLKPLVEKYSDLGVTVIFTLGEKERPYRTTPWTKENIGLFPGLDLPVDESIWSEPLQRMFFYHPEGKHLQDCRKDLAKFENEFSVSFQNRKSIQIAPHGCTKASGVHMLSKILGIQRDQILCIGDADNDLEMIRYAGIGVAVNNASEELKRAAKYVTSLDCAEGVEEVMVNCGRN